MSKMGQHLESQLDKHKYEMYKALRKLVKWFGKYPSWIPNNEYANDPENDIEYARGILQKIERF